MRKEMLEKFLKIDRRIIFLLLTLVLFIPIVKPLNLPIGAVSVDTKKQATAIVRHCFKKDLRVGVITFIAGATGLIEEIFEKVPQEYRKEYGKDYVIFPYQADYSAVLTQMGFDLYQIYDKDKFGTHPKNLPVMQGIKSYKDMGMGICITGTALLDGWVAFAGDKFKFPLGGGVTAVSQPGYGPYLQTGQLVGLLGGMKGGAEYESLLGIPGKGTSGIDALNLGHFMVVILILISNIIIIVTRYF
ncbi:MAG: hypothetical protein HY746_05010 [Elusimicrobia bacterium]|nr:hypothetical protein [Elusimicrobiota bacterium]